MRILYLTGHYPPDLTSGATLQVARLATAARRAGHDVRVVAGAHRSGLADGATRDESVDGIEVRWIGTGGWTDQDRDENWWNPAAADVVARLLDSWQPDVVHAHALQTLGADSLLAASTRGIRTVVTMHDFWWTCARLFLVDRSLQPCALVPDLGGCECARSSGWRRDRERRLRDVLDRVDLVLTPSASVRDVLAANGIAAVVDPNDVDLDGLDEVREYRRVQLGTTPAIDTPRGDVRFLYVGGPNPLKGADVLRGAASSLASTSGWRLSAHGLPGPSRPPVWTAPPFDPRDRAHVLADADVLVLPSLARESFSLAAREALRAGLAVVTSDCLGPEEIVHHDVNGLVVPTGDVEALAAAMRVLVTDRDLLKRLQKGALDTDVASLDADTHLATLVALYRESPRVVTRERRVRVVAAADHHDEAVRQVESLRAAGWETQLATPEAPTPGAENDLTLVVGDVDRPGGAVIVHARPTPRIRIVIVNHEGRDLTLRCIQHLDALTYPHDLREVVVVDNDSHDGLVEHLRANRPDVRVVAESRNRGFGAGCNAGIALPGEWDAVALVNNDSVPAPGWLDALVATWYAPPVTSHPVGAVAGKVLLGDSALINSAGCTLLAGGFNADRGDGLPDDGSFDTPCEVFGWSGASVLLTRALIDDIGVFDESFFLYYEDVDMVWRGRRRGWSVAYAPGAVSRHDRGATAGRGDQFWFHDTRNRLMVLARHAPATWLPRAVAIQLRAALSGGPGPRRAVRLRALGSLLVRAPRLAHERRRLAHRASVNLDDIVAWRDR